MLDSELAMANLAGEVIIHGRPAQAVIGTTIIPHYRLGRRLVVFAVPEIQEWMKERRVAVADGSRP